jgi:hypothetical protein
LQSRINVERNEVREKAVSKNDKPSSTSSVNSRKDLRLQNDNMQTVNKSLQNENLFEQLLSPKRQNENIPFQLVKKKRKRKKKNFGL